MRRLPVIQPTPWEQRAFERRAFLLGLVGVSVAACASEAEPGYRPRGTGSSGSSGGTTKDGGVTTKDGGGDGGGPGPGNPGTDGGSDAASGMDATTSQGCEIDGFEVGAANTFAMGTITYVAAPGGGAYVGRDAGGLYAMYALCTHTIGNLVQEGAQLRCLVHSARFTLTGDLVNGPATIGLPHYALCMKNGKVAVDTKVIVASSTRLVA